MKNMHREHSPLFHRQNSERKLIFFIFLSSFAYRDKRRYRFICGLYGFKLFYILKSTDDYKYIKS